MVIKSLDFTIILAAIIAAIPPTIAVIINRRKTGRDLEVIHSLVNSRLTTALDEISELRNFIDSRIPGGKSSADFVPPKTEQTSP